MTPVLRIEIIIDALHSPRVLEGLRHADVTGWTMLRAEAGSGDRGERRMDDLSGASTNHVVLTTCEADQLDGLMATLRPMLERWGGICLVSEARWLKH